MSGNYEPTQIAELTDVIRRQSECVKINSVFLCCIVSARRAMPVRSEQHPNCDDQNNSENELAVFLFDAGVAQSR